MHYSVVIQKQSLSVLKAAILRLNLPIRCRHRGKNFFRHFRPASACWSSPPCACWSSPPLLAGLSRGVLAGHPRGVLAGHAGHVYVCHAVRAHASNVWHLLWIFQQLQFVVSAALGRTLLAIGRVHELVFFLRGVDGNFSMTYTPFTLAFFTVPARSGTVRFGFT